MNDEPNGGGIRRKKAVLSLIKGSMTREEMVENLLKGLRKSGFDFEPGLEERALKEARLYDQANSQDPQVIEEQEKRAYAQRKERMRRLRLAIEERDGKSRG